MALPHGKQVVPSRERYSLAVLLQTHPEGIRINGELQATQATAEHSAQAAKVALQGEQVPLGLSRLPATQPLQVNGPKVQLAQRPSVEFPMQKVQLAPQTQVLLTISYPAWHVLQ
jgi:hypothetical protein